MTFTIRIEVKFKWYNLTVQRFYVGESIEKFRVSAGERYFILQCNRPEVVATKSNRAIKWKVIEGEFKPGNPQDAALGLFKVFQAIESHLNPKEGKNVHQRKK